MAKGRHLANKSKPAEKKKAPKSEKRSKRGRNVVLGIVLGVTAVIALCALGGFIVGSGDTVYPNISIGGVSLGGMTVSEATAALNDAGWNGGDISPVTVSLPGDREFTVTADDAGLRLDAEEAAQAAYAYGHGGDPFENLLAYFKCIAGKTDGAAITAAVDEKALKAKVESELSEFKKLASEAQIDEEAATLSLIKGAESMKLDADELCSLIAKAFEQGDERISYAAGIEEAETPDFEKLREKIKCDPVDAAYDAENHCLTQSKAGLDFDPEEAAKLFDKAKPGELVVIPLTVTQPKLSSETLGTELFADCLGSKTTTFKSSSSDRCTNVRLAAEKIDGVVLNPGETFSFNDVVGKRTSAAGFKPAGAYAGGKEVTQIGGGICQVSSTLYCSALLANLKITARDCHYFAVSYLPYGMDATVSWGGPEFKFKNDRDYPVKIVAKCDMTERSLTVEIWGTDVDGSYVEITYAASTAYDNRYPDVAIGTNATTYRNVYAADGTLLSRTKEDTSYYHYHEENIKWPEEPTPSPAPTPSEEPTPTPSAEPTPTETPAPAEP